MSSYSSSSSVMRGYYCVKERKPCVRWVDKYFKDCLCNIKDDVSFGFGILSLVCWGVAEIPQIITNFRTKSSHGVSLAFLLTWVAGDIFNLLGCFLEPATLPTQFYTALLYTSSTVVLVLQSLYYDHIYRWRKRRHVQSHSHTKASSDEKEALRGKGKADERAIPIPDHNKASPARRDFYYTSARSLAGSGTPPFRSFINNNRVAMARSGPSALELNTDHSSSDDEAPPPPPPSRPRPIPQSASYGTFFATAASLPFQSKGLYLGLIMTTIHEGGMEHSVVGQWLGWLMATIYMGGRIPQIYLNIKRGSVEGLNPLMFVFALVANVAYVGSIVVRTTEWESIKPNMAWLLDAVVCVGLDLFIILQYIFYRYLRKSESEVDVQEDPKDASF